MKYTNETLHGLIYQHATGGTIFRVIQIHDNRTYSHTTCDIKTGVCMGPWITLENANNWIKDGTWILQAQDQSITNNYEIY